MASRSYDPHRSRVHRPTGEDGSGWREARRAYIREHCREANVRTAGGRKRCEQVCGDRFCCFETATGGYSCRYDEGATCEADHWCRNILVGLARDYEETEVHEDNDGLALPTLAGVNLPSVDFGEVPSTPLGDNFDVQQMRSWFNEKKEEERVLLKGSLVLMELEEETGGEVGVVRKYLTRTYNRANPRTTCYNPLYQSDENGDAILQRAEYTKFVAGLSEGAVDLENYIDFSFAFKVNFNYLSCQCKFHSNPSLHGGEGCCLGPEAGIHISGAGPHEVPTKEEEAHLQLVCLTAQGTIDYERGPVPDTALPTYSPVPYKATFHPTTVISVPTKYPSSKPTAYFISFNQPTTTELPTPSPIKTRTSIGVNPTQTDTQFPSSPNYLWRPPPIPSAEPSQLSEASDITTGDNYLWLPPSIPSVKPSHLSDANNVTVRDGGDAESGTTPGVVVGIILCVIIFGLYTFLSLVGKLRKDDDDEEVYLRDQREVSSLEVDSEADSRENADI